MPIDLPGIDSAIASRRHFPKLFIGGSHALRDYSSSPSRELALKYNPDADATITNIAEIVNAMPYSGYGFAQFYAATLNADLNKKLEESTILMSIDANY